MYSVTRYHDISCGHRVVGHESKCRHLHGHNYRIHFTCSATELDTKGRVIDFSEIKNRLCMWLENNWDHKFLAWEEDTLIEKLSVAFTGDDAEDYADAEMFNDSIVKVPFNPTAENIAKYLVEVVAPRELEGTGVFVIWCNVEETRKCSAMYIIEK